VQNLLLVGTQAGLTAVDLHGTSVRPVLSSPIEQLASIPSAGEVVAAEGSQLTLIDAEALKPTSSWLVPGSTNALAAGTSCVAAAHESVVKLWDLRSARTMNTFDCAATRLGMDGNLIVYAADEAVLARDRRMPTLEIKLLPSIPTAKVSQLKAEDGHLIALQTSIGERGGTGFAVASAVDLTDYACLGQAEVCIPVTVVAAVPRAVAIGVARGPPGAVVSWA